MTSFADIMIPDMYKSCRHRHFVTSDYRTDPMTEMSSIASSFSSSW